MPHLYCSGAGVAAESKIAKIIAAYCVRPLAVPIATRCALAIQVLAWFAPRLPPSDSETLAAARSTCSIACIAAELPYAAGVRTHHRIVKQINHCALP